MAVWKILRSRSYKKILTESHPDTARIARSKQHFGNSNSEANRCIGVYTSDRLQQQF